MLQKRRLHSPKILVASSNLSPLIEYTNIPFRGPMIEKHLVTGRIQCTMFSGASRQDPISSYL